MHKKKREEIENRTDKKSSNSLWKSFVKANSLLQCQEKRINKVVINIYRG